MATQVNEARSAFLRLKRDISDVENAVFSEWCDFVNKYLYSQVSILEPSRFTTTQDYTVSSAPSTQSLPADLKNINADQTGVYVINDAGELTERQLAYTGPGSGATGYYLDGDNIVFTGNPVATYRLVYLPVQTTLSDLSDYFTLDGTVTGTPILLARHLEYAVKALDVLYNQWDENPGQESLSDFRFTRALSWILEDYKRTPLSYSTPDYSQTY